MAKKKFGFGDLYCVFCGEGIEKNADTCPRCGHAYSDSNYDDVPREGGGIGWSTELNNPCFKQAKRKNLIFTFFFMIIVSIIICAVIYLTSDMELEECLPIFAGVMAIIWVFWIIWLIFQNVGKKGWEGNVVDKDDYVKEFTTKDDEGYRQTETKHVYEIEFKTTTGKKKVKKDYDDSNWYDYFNIGDLVRYHGKMNYYEKYDKSHDATIPCASCGAVRDARDTYCGRCGCIMLKFAK